jgi:hypothetical protein
LTSLNKIDNRVVKNYSQYSSPFLNKIFKIKAISPTSLSFYSRYLS